MQVGAFVGGNWNNSSHVGAFYDNLNNPVSNANTNNGAAQFCPKYFCIFLVVSKIYYDFMLLRNMYSSGNILL